MRVMFKIDDIIPDNNQQWRKDVITAITKTSSVIWVQAVILNIAALIVYTIYHI